MSYIGRKDNKIIYIFFIVYVWQLHLNKAKAFLIIVCVMSIDLFLQC